MQGQSAWTDFKEARFVPVLAQSLLISKASSIARYAYYHVDLNSGGGYNSVVHVPGSPLNFLRAVERHRRHNFYAFFVDQDLGCVRELIVRPEIEANSERVAIFHADNSEVLPVVAEFVAARERNPHHAVGSIVIDPNGYHKGVPWDALRAFCRAHPKFDLFFNLNIRTYRLERPHIESGEWSAHQLHPLSTFHEWFARPNWMITPLCQIAGSTWIQCVGRTMRTASVGYSQLGFYDSESDRGRWILDAVNQPSEREAARTAPQLPLLSEL